MSVGQLVAVLLGLGCLAVLIAGAAVYALWPTQPVRRNPALDEPMTAEAAEKLWKF